MLTEQDEMLFTQAVEKKEQGRLQEALFLLMDILQRNPTHPGIHYLIGLVYWNLEQLPEAITSFVTATQLRPENEEISLCLFHSLWESGLKYEALDEAKRFVRNTHSETYRTIIEAINAKADE